MKKQKNSTHTSVWIENKVLEECKSNMERLEIKFFKDYVAEALKFYNRYLKDKSNEEYINKTVFKREEEAKQAFARQSRKINVQASG